MEYQVPQFIEVEDKIIGPLALKQFIYLAGGAGFAVLTYFYLPFILWIIVATPVVALAGALAFYKVNGKSFSSILEAAFSYYIGSKLFLWRKEEPKIEVSKEPAPQGESPLVTKGGPRLTSGKLHDLAWSLDIKKGEEEERQ
jgi:hypothetical protein